MEQCSFRWAYCLLKTLRPCFPLSIRLILDEILTTPDETYERTLLAIPDEKLKLVPHLFKRPEAESVEE